MYRSRTAGPVQMPAVLRLFVRGLLFTVLAFAVFSCVRPSPASDVAALEPIASAAAPAAVTAQRLPDPAGLLAHSPPDDGGGGALGRDCSKKPSSIEGPPSPRTACYETGFLPVAKPLASVAVPAAPYRIGRIGPAPPAPAPILLSVLRI